MNKCMPERRAEARFLCADLVRVEWCDRLGRTRRSSAVLEDISPSGACLQFEKSVPLDTVLHDELVKHGKDVRMEVYEHGYHDFVLGNQGQKRGDLPRGEFLMQGALDALDLTVKYVKAPR